MRWRYVLPMAAGLGLLTLLAYGFSRDPREIRFPLIGKVAYHPGRLAWGDAVSGLRPGSCPAHSVPRNDHQEKGPGDSGTEPPGGPRWPDV